MKSALNAQRALGYTTSRVPAGYGVDTRLIDALVARACETDGAFSEHSRNVAAVSVRVGRELQLTGGELELLELAAVVHDLGKLCVPPEIISKPGSLDADEWIAMRSHPAAGADLLEPCEAPAEVLEIVRSHHERWDGTGYPDGLKGTEIPLGARIIAVADAFCAMLEARPYRAPLRPAAARAELLAEAGRQFDAACAQAAYRVTAAAG
jgi:putative nucleotidyltransferase with HDIG domain